MRLQRGLQRKEILRAVDESSCSWCLNPPLWSGPAFWQQLTSNKLLHCLLCEYSTRLHLYCPVKLSNKTPARSENKKQNMEYVKMFVSIVQLRDFNCSK